MGGLVCAIRRNAVLRFQEVPTQAKKLEQFDAQIRELYNAPAIAEAVESETSRAQEACDILAKHAFTQDDRIALFEIIESLYESA